MAGESERTTALEAEPAAPTALAGASPQFAAALAGALGNQAMARLARHAASDPRARAALTTPAGLRALARNGPLDAGVAGGAVGTIDAAAPGPDATLAGPAAVTAEAAGAAPTAAPAPDRDTIVRDAINTALAAYQNLTVQVPTAMPPAPGAHPAPAAPAAGPAGAGPDGAAGPAGAAAGGAAGGAAGAAGPTPVSFASPYYINRSSGDGGAASGTHALDGAGVRPWFNGLPAAVKVGKGTADQLQAAMQAAVDRGLLNATWPPSAENLRAFMQRTGLGVDCSGFVYEALTAADAAVQAAGLPAMTPMDSGITGMSSQAIGRQHGTRITNPADLRPGDIIQMAPNAGHAVGHIRILTAVRAGADFVEYDTAESTTRVGSGPQASTWRIPAAGPMDTAHLEVRDAAGAWSAETTLRPSSYWRRLSTAAPAPAAAGGTVAPKLARNAPRAGGWNEADRDVTGTWRIPVTGLTQGLATDSANPATREDSQHRATAVVPRSVSNSNLEVLLHFHGNNLGERERRTASSSGMAAGTVRDVEGDLIPQQLSGSGRNMIAILPQGTVDSGTLATKFGISNPQAYVTDVLAQVLTHVNTLDPTKRLQALTPVRVVISGHSGGGPATVAAAAGQEATSASTDHEWAAAPPLLLFDAINGANELTTVAALMRRWLEEDKRRLLAKPGAEALALLARRGLKLRSTYTSGVYHATNSKNPPRTYQYPPRPPVTIPAADSLEAKRDAWFAANGGALGALAAPLLAQYRIEHMAGAHDFTVGTGSAQTGPRSAVGGVTQAPGAPAGSNEAPTENNGNLAAALALLSPADQVAGTP